MNNTTQNNKNNIYKELNKYIKRYLFLIERTDLNKDNENTKEIIFLEKKMDELCMELM